MSYSRWSQSSWYASMRGGVADSDRNAQILSLYHRDDEATQSHSWTYQELRGADEEWLRKHYNNLTDIDVAEGMRIIITFRRDVDYNWLKYTLLNPTLENISLVLDEFVARQDFRFSIGDFHDYCPTDTWQEPLLSRLESLNTFKITEILIDFLENVTVFKDRQRVLSLLISWRKILQEIVSQTTPSACILERSSEEILLANIFGTPLDSRDIVRKALPEIDMLIKEFRDNTTC